MSLFWEIHQYKKIHDAQTEADRAYYSAKDAKSTAMDIRAVAHKSLLICEALWSIMQEKLGVTEEELYERVREIDLSDGQLDGRKRRNPLKCNNCGRVTGRRHPRCIYCGDAIPVDPFVT